MEKDKRRREKRIEKVMRKNLRDKNQKELKTKAHNRLFIYPPNPQYTPNFGGDTVAPVLTDTLVSAPDKGIEEEEKPIEEEDRDNESDYGSDDTVTILRAEYV